MTSVPEPPAGPWEPPSYRVDEQGKVLGAAPGIPNNWRRWGDDDQRGTANLFSADRARAAAALVRTGETFSLSVPVGRGAANFGTRAPAVHTFTSTTGDAVLGDLHAHGVETNDDVILMPLQGGTHLDGLAHVAAEHVMYNGYWSGLATSRSGPRRLGAQHWAGGLVGRAVLVDVARHCDLDPYRGVVDVAALEATLAAQQTAIEPGDVLLVRTGWLRAKCDDEDSPRTRQAGVAPSIVEWLAALDIAMLAVDNRTVEAIPNPEGDELLPFHRRAIRDLGLVLGELFWLEELAEHCHATSCADGLFVAAPLPIIAASGAPLNPLVIM